ncbi:MAG: SufE family protein [Simkania sp.]|nr:SufE family protein [Simkania sp.]
MSWDFSSCLARQDALIKLFSQSNEPQSRYTKLIEMGRELAKNSHKEVMLAEHLVRGCQSEVFLVARIENGKIFFDIYTEALISAGLVAILLHIYQGEPAEVILKCPPSCLTQLGLQASLTPARSNGLASIYLKMQQDVLRFLINRN